MSEMSEVVFPDPVSGWQPDDRGWVYFPFQHLSLGQATLEMLAACHVIAIAPGQVRGQHLHPQKTEWLFLIAGAGTLFWRDREDYLQRQTLGEARRLAMIAPGVPHALRNDGTDMLYLLAWRAASPQAATEPETIPVALI